jgi:polyketide cyclase/dehydrase/lipid transport protein
MASIRQEIPLDVPADDVWDAVRDIGALHHRLVKGFVTDTKLDGDARIVTFAHGMVVREVIVDLDDAARRLVWIANLLPDERAGDIRAMIDAGAAAMTATLERR